MENHNTETKEKSKEVNNNLLYVNSTIGVPQGDEDKFKLSIEENTKFVDFIYDKITQDPSLLKKRPHVTSIANFKIRKTHAEKFKKIQAMLKPVNLSFSKLYRQLYAEFISYTLKKNKSKNI